MTIAVDLGRKATKQTKTNKTITVVKMEMSASTLGGPQVKQHTKPFRMESYELLH